MSCPEQFDLLITDGSSVSHGLVCAWDRGGAGVKIPKPESLSSTAVSTKGDFGVRDVDDFYRIVQTDWSEGCGQRTYDREIDSPNAFYLSNNIDVSNVGELRVGPHRIQAAHGNSSPAILSARIGGTSYVFRALTTSPWVEYATNPNTWTGCGAAIGGTVTAFATDGIWVYAVKSDGTLWVGNNVGFVQLAETDMTNIVRVAWASGTLYIVKTVASAFQLGFRKYATSAYQYAAISPAQPWLASLYGTTFGLTSCGHEVYWGVANGTVTKVYRALYTGTTTNGVADDYIKEVCTLPHGFVGASLYAYGKTVYVGGHYDGYDSNSTGIGAIYAIEDGNLALLTDVGEDRSIDNRVLAMVAYGKYLYFFSQRQLWRWDLVRGGYSQYGGPYTAPYPTGAGLTAARDLIWSHLGPSYGTYVTTPYNQFFNNVDGFGAASLTSSASSGNMPTVDKYFDSIVVELAEALPAGWTLTPTVVIDGSTYATTYAASRSTTTSRVYTIARQGRRLNNYKLTLTSANSLQTTTPRITEVAIQFTPMPKSTRTYTYYVRCWEKTESRIKGALWEEDAQAVADWLESIANTVVTVERPGRAAFTAKVDNVEYLEAPPARKAHGREGLYQLDLRWLA